MLERLAGVCEEAAREVGLPPEGRPFVAHLTLSRLRPSSDVRGILGRFDSFAVPISVGAITLFRTQPGRDGITYRRIESLPLVGR